MTIADGAYRAQVVEYEFGEASTGSEQIAVALDLYDGETKVGNLTWYGYFSDAAIDGTLKALQTMGWQSEDLRELDAIKGKWVQAVVEEEPDQEGVMRPRIRWINAEGGVRIKKRLDEGRKEALANRVRARMMKNNSGGRKLAATGTDGGGFVDDDDDIGF